MSGVNKVIIIGNLGKDPELRTLENGKQVANFSVATSKSWKNDQGEKKEKTEWHNIVVWEKLAEIADKYLEKGSKVYIEGELQTRSWEKDGVKRYSTEILARNMQMLSAKTSQDSPSNISEVSQGAASQGEVDDLPF